jgi:hypothetical protein
MSPSEGVELGDVALLASAVAGACLTALSHRDSQIYPTPSARKNKSSSSCFEEFVAF